MESVDGQTKKKYKRKTKRRKSKNTRRKKSKTVSLFYYKMKNCKYCKEFEKKSWKKILKFCKQKNIKTKIIIRELNPELIPPNIHLFPSLVKYDNKNKSTLFKGERNINKIKKFLI
jgi:hypothetical protein